jgi:hypothetical protein
MGGGGKGGGGGGTTSTINLGGTTNVDSDSTVTIEGLDNIKAALTLGTAQPFRTESKQELAFPQPLRTESKQELVLPQPLRTDSNLKTDSNLNTNSGITVDVKPLVVDLCLNLSQGPVQPTCIRQPYQHHFGVTLFGIELWGFNFSGESQTIIQGLTTKPQVAWGGEESRDQPGASTRPPPQVSRPASGLRIRLDR